MKDSLNPAISSRSSIRLQFAKKSVYSRINLAAAKPRKVGKSSKKSSEDASKLSLDRKYLVTGLAANFKIEREIVLKGLVDDNLTSWESLSHLMHLALKADDHPLITKIISPSLAVQVIDNVQSDDTLWRALEMNDLNMAMELIRAKPDLNRRHRGTGQSYLHWAVTQKDEKYMPLVVLLLESGSDLNATDMDGCSVLEIALEYGCPQVIKLLVQWKAPIDVLSFDKISLMTIAGERDDCMEFLPELVNSAKDTRTRTIRCVHAYFGLYDTGAPIELIRKLLDLKFSLDRIGRNGSTLLQEAVSNGEIEIVELLLEYGACVHKKLKSDKTPIKAAVAHKDTKLTKILMAKGAMDKSCEKYTESYPLHSACKEKSLANMKLLLEYGESVIDTDKNHRTPYSYAFSKTFDEAQALIIQYLVKSDKPINVLDLKKIESNLDAKKYYEKCLEEVNAKMDVE